MAAIFESFFQMAKLIIALHQLYTTPAMTCKNDVNFRFRLYICFTSIGTQGNGFNLLILHLSEVQMGAVLLPHTYSRL